MRFLLACMLLSTASFAQLTGKTFCDLYFNHQDNPKAVFTTLQQNGFTRELGTISNNHINLLHKKSVDEWVRWNKNDDGVAFGYSCTDRSRAALFFSELEKRGFKRVPCEEPRIYTVYKKGDLTCRFKFMSTIFTVGIAKS